MQLGLKQSGAHLHNFNNIPDYIPDSQVLTIEIGTFKNARQRVFCHMIMSFQGTAHASCRLSCPLSNSRTRSSWFSHRPRLRTPFTKTHLVRRSWLRHVHCMRLSTYCRLIRQVLICSQLCWHIWAIDMNDIHVHTVYNFLISWQWPVMAWSKWSILATRDTQFGQQLALVMQTTHAQHWQYPDVSTRVCFLPLKMYLHRYYKNPWVWV